VLLLDVNMPGLSGPETFLALRALHPEVRCCFMTGDLGRYTEDGLLAVGAARVLYKPVAVAEIVEALRELTGHSPRGA
jgi:DNA-binding NarL/FixJ family response regulator